MKVAIHPTKEYMVVATDDDGTRIETWLPVGRELLRDLIADPIDLDTYRIITSVVTRELAEGKVRWDCELDKQLVYLKYKAELEEHGITPGEFVYVVDNAILSVAQDARSTLSEGSNFSNGMSRLATLRS